MQPYFKNLSDFFQRLTVSQKISLVVVLAGTAAALVGIAYWANRPDYALLFGKLSATDASRVVEALKEQNIRYELRENGSSVFVPRENVYELRLSMASEGLVSDGQMGYELFDQNNLGMTDFMQKVNLRRALEGELAKTITNIRQVEQCRVHLVSPERSPFKESQARPSASVVLQLSGGTTLAASQIEGITALVSGAVEGLSPAEVTILDTRGNLLSNPDAGNPDLAMSSTQLRAQREIETHLTENGQTMLNKVLGPGNSIVRVVASLDFSKTVSEREIIDPESATVISEEKLDEELDGQTSNSAVKNYELSRTRERLEKSVGDVSYLTISVIVNYKRVPPPADQPDATATEAPHTDDELKEIEALVKNAVGFNPERGDRFAIHQTRFDTSANDQAVAEMKEIEQKEQMNLYIRYGAILASVLLGFLLLRSLMKKGKHAGSDREELPPATAMAQLPGRTEQAGLNGRSPQRAGLPEPTSPEEEMVLIDDVYTSKLSNEAKARLKAKHLMYEELKKQANERPDEAADLIRSWLAEDLLSAN